MPATRPTSPFSSLSNEEKVRILAQRYHLSPSGVITLAIEQFWQKKGSQDSEIRQVELIKAFLEKQEELDTLRALIEDDL